MCPSQTSQQALLLPVSKENAIEYRDRKPPVDFRLLWHVRYARGRRCLLDPSAFYGEQAHYGFEQGAFAGAVGADHAQRLAAVELDGDIAQRPEVFLLYVAPAEQADKLVLERTVAFAALDKAAGDVAQFEHWLACLVNAVADDRHSSSPKRSA